MKPSASANPARPCAVPRVTLILSDQPSPDVRALKMADRNHHVILMAEVHHETSYVPHHKRKSPSSFLPCAMAPRAYNHGTRRVPFEGRDRRLVQ